MITYTDIKPAEADEIAEHDCDLWVICEDDIGVYAIVGCQFIDHDASIHFEVKRFGGMILKQLVKDWEGLKYHLRGCGIKNVIASNWETEKEHWQKFIGYFGFSEPVKMLVSQQYIGE